MNLAAGSPSLLSRLRAGWLTWLSLIAFAFYGYFCWRNTWTMPGGADSSGYFNLARCLDHGDIRVPMRTVEGLPVSTAPAYAYIPLGFIPDHGAATMTPTYPLGLPLLFMVATRVFGPLYGTDLVLWLHTLAAVALVYALVRQAGATQTGALIGTAALAVSPLFLTYAFQAMSDLPALTWCAAALWFAGRRTSPMALLAGFAAGYAVLVRPSNAVIFPALLVALGLDWRRLLAFGAGGLPCAVALALFNRAAYGSPLASGYGNIGELMSFEWVPMTLAHFARWIPMLLSPLMLLAFAAPWLARTKPAALTVHLLCALGVFGFYAFYYHTHETWWYLRFVLPAFPSLIVLAVLAGEKLLERLSSRFGRIALAVLAAAIVIGNGVAWSRHFEVRSAGRNERIYRKAIQLALEQTPPEAVVLAMQTSGSLFYGTDRIIVRWDTLDGNWARVRDAVLAARRPIYAVFFDFEVERAFGNDTPGKWTKLLQHEQLSVWRLDAVN